MTYLTILTSFYRVTAVEAGLCDEKNENQEMALRRARSSCGSTWDALGIGRERTCLRYSCDVKRAGKVGGEERKAVREKKTAGGGGRLVKWGKTTLGAHRDFPAGASSSSNPFLCCSSLLDYYYFSPN